MIVSSSEGLSEMITLRNLEESNSSDDNLF